MSSARHHSSHQTDNIANIEPSGGPVADFHVHSSRTRQSSERLTPESSGYLGSSKSALFQAPEIRSQRSFSNSTYDRSSMKSSSSLPTQPKPSSEEWNLGMSPKPLPKTFHEPDRKVSADSKRPARQGWEWVWVLEGSWVKRDSTESLPLPKEKLTPKRLRRSLPVRKAGSVYRSNLQDSSSRYHREYSGGLSISGVANSDVKTIKRPPFLLSGAISSSGTSLSGSKLLRGFQYMSPTYPHFRSPTGEPEGLYCKTKRGIGGGLIRKSKEDVSKLVLSSQEELPSRTTATLKGATSALGQSEQDATHPSTHFFVGGRRPSTASKRLGKQIGVAPWHRRNSQDSTWSVTSSIREVLRGKTPISTPNPKMQYGGHKGKKYTKVDITRKEEPTFLPSEAIQVQTPPPSSAGKASAYSHGFFLDLSPSSNDQDLEDASSDRTLIASAKSETAKKAHIPSRGKREWWDDMEISFDSDTPVIKTQIGPLIRGQIEPPRFEWNTPEHLPNSPLCPLIQKEKQRHTGNSSDICVYHGRK